MVNTLLFGRRKSDDDTVVEMLASAIRRDISFGVLRPDQKLKLADLRQAYGGSNHSMRETLRIALHHGLHLNCHITRRRLRDVGNVLSVLFIKTREIFRRGFIVITNF